uniref:DUF4907 domain-containing protein n=1 Tax=Rhodopseudomonas palustris (strain BisA53) TaxID=316055 RepID=Q07ST5_RHOP5
MKRIVAAAAGVAIAGALTTVGAFAHHGWGRYDSANPVTVTGPIQSSAYENPHATITIKGADKVWTVILAPTSRMSARGASADMVAVGKIAQAYGYPSTATKDEMRAERIIIDGKTVELR